jgi:hypothetical protein
MMEESDDQSYESEASEVSDKIVKQKRLRKNFNITTAPNVTQRRRKPTANLGKCEFLKTVLLN